QPSRTRVRSSCPTEPRARARPWSWRRRWARFRSRVRSVASPNRSPMGSTESSFRRALAPPCGATRLPRLTTPGPTWLRLRPHACAEAIGSSERWSVHLPEALMTLFATLRDEPIDRVVALLDALASQNVAGPNELVVAIPPH